MSEKMDVKTLYAITKLMISDGTFFNGMKDANGKLYVADANEFTMGNCKLYLWAFLSVITRTLQNNDFIYWYYLISESD